MNLRKIKDVRSVLFGLATLSIVLFHTYDLEFPFEIFNILRDSGDIGVEIFLFLSGVGLFQSMKNTQSLKAFYIRRFLRITPAVMITALIKQLLLSNATITQNIINLTILLYLRSGWYFGFIAVLYILFPLIFKLTVMYREKFTLLLTGMCVLGCLILSRIDIGFYNYTSLMSTRIPIFLAGTLFGLYVSEGLEIRKKWVVLNYIILIASCFAVIWFYKQNYYLYIKPIIYYFLAISMILAIANNNFFSKCSLIEKGLIWIGRYSMEIYLIYETVWSICQRTMKPFFTNIGIYFGVMFGITLLSSMILKYFSEKSIDWINTSLLSHRAKGT